MAYLRALLAVLLLAGLIYFTGIQELLSAFANVRVPYLIALLLISPALIWLSCMKWRLFIREWGHDVPILELMKFYTLTYFYNTFAPSAVVGDVMRSYHLGNHLNNQKEAFVVTVLERATGLIAMVLLGTTFVALNAQVTSGLESAILLVSFTVILLAFICFSEQAFVFTTALAILISRKLGLIKLSERLAILFEKVSRAVKAGLSNEYLFFRAMFWSLCFHFGTVINTYLAAKAIGWDDPDFAGLCVAVPLVLIVSIASITPGAVGIQEGAFTFFLERVGAMRTEALGVGLILRAKNLCVALVGWALWIQLKKSKSDFTLGDVPANS